MALVTVKGPNGGSIMIEEENLQEYQAALYTVVETVESPSEDVTEDFTEEIENPGIKPPALPVAEKVVLSKSAKKIKGTKAVDPDESSDDFDVDYD